MMKKLLAAAAVVVTAVLLAPVSGPAKAATVLPFGPQNDVAYNTVVNTWGWNVIYRGDYNQNVPLATLLNGAQAYIMLAAIRDGSTTFDVLAATTLADFQTYTALNVSHLSNGAQWYYNGYSMGFAGAGDAIVQNSADIGGTTFNGPVNERDRLSWHGLNQDYHTTPNGLTGGWRSGSNIFLNSVTNWDRVVLTTNVITAAVPEPSTWAMMLIGFAGLGFLAQRKLKAKAVAA